MRHHPATALVPKMKQPDYRRLRDDIASHGQQTPIVVHDGMVLDGRYRLKACLELGIEPNVVRLTEDEIGGDAEAYVRSANLCRRQTPTGIRRSDRRPALKHVQRSAGYCHLVVISQSNTLTREE